MNVELPDFLLHMSEQMNNQDNRCTSDVIFQVKQKQYFVTEEGYNEHHFILQDDAGEFFRSDTGSEKVAKEYLLEYYEEACADWLAENRDHETIDHRGTYDLFIDEFNIPDDIEDFHRDVKKLAVQEIDVVLHTCFTEQEALAIAARYSESAQVFTYGVSLYQCHQTRQLRNWIESLARNKKGEPS